MRTSTVSKTQASAGELAERVRAASAARTPLRIVGGDTKAFYGRIGGGVTENGERLDVTGHHGIIDYEPSELVITARAGTPIEEIEALLAQRGQRLSFEPPVLGPASTLGGVVATGFSGPRRPFAGAVRDSVLGVTVLNGRGEALRLGGTVFKNVAGFDGFRLMAGALGCLGVLLDVSVRVSPVPAAEVSRSFELAWPTAQARLTAMLRSPIPISGAAHDGERLHLRLSGPAGVVAGAVAELGGEKTPVSFWEDLRHRRTGPFTASRLWRLSVSRTAEVNELPGPVMRDWAGAEIWLASDEPAEQIRRLATRAGGHATLYRGAAPDEDVFSPLSPPLLALHQRLKAAFDPAGVFNPGRMYKDL